jgi:hypothetical protein
MPSISFTTAGAHSWNVPTKVKSVTVSIDGAGSGNNGGGRVIGILAVSDTWNLYCYVGQSGRANSGGSGGAATSGGGAAGGAGHSQDGGDSGGGASFIRVNNGSGSIKAVAGGAGGNSGDGGLGGAGGGTTGGSGRQGNAGTNPVGASTGGTQSQGGNGGTSAAGAQFNGHNASDSILVTGGAGGSAGSNVRCHGGGGGGGGYRPGGGGQASSPGYAAGGGGGGGSSYTGGLTGATNVQGAGGAGTGSITISWVDPSSPNHPPTPPSTPKVNKVAASDGMSTKSTGSVDISAVVNDPDSGEQVRLAARWSTNSNLSNYKEVRSGLVVRGQTAEVKLTGLSQNTRYYVRLYAIDQHGLWSTGYNSLNFWTNRKPTSPTGLTINTQGEGMTLPSLSSATLQWTHNDPDGADYQTAFALRWRVAANSVTAAGVWHTETHAVGQNLPPKVAGPPTSSTNQWVLNPGTFKGNTFYEWAVQTRDQQGLWGDWSLTWSFYVSSTTTPPKLLTPHNNTSVDVEKPTTFTWQFIDPDAGDRQKRADLRYRVLGVTKELSVGIPPDPTDWILLPGAVDPGVPGSKASWTISPLTFQAEYSYEWSVRTYDSIGGNVSDWSDSFFFYAINPPGSEAGPLPTEDVSYDVTSLGCGTYRVFLYAQGGIKRIGELTPLSHLTFTRLRDDISNCVVTSSGYSIDCGALYGEARCWMHEIVVFRNGQRVWEGPVTRIGYAPDSVEFEAKDVMVYTYRRLMRAGYNDSYRLVQKGTGGQPNVYLGLLSVVRRAALLITEALAPYDPNVLPYLTTIEYGDDAQEARVVADWSRSAWEEVDDLAATAGLDYTVVGRRIMLWDTHRPVGRLPELRDSDFSNAPVVTEYGMQLANFMAVTNGAGIAGTAQVAAKAQYYGPIEMLASSYSDTSAASGEVTTPDALVALQKAMADQANRNMAHRWPTPVIVRVPDNSTLSPNVNIGFQQLIPGVWLPLRSTNTPRTVLQWQKLDSVSVDVQGDNETVSVVLSPAPNQGEDPDANTTPPAEGG